MGSTKPRAGNMVSSIGKATIVPSPRSAVRRAIGGCFRTAPSRARALTERIAQDDSDDQARKTIAVMLEAANDRLDGAPIRWVQASAQGVGEELFAEAADKLIAPAQQQRP